MEINKGDRYDDIEREGGGGERIIRRK